MPIERDRGPWEVVVDVYGMDDRDFGNGLIADLRDAGIDFARVTCLRRKDGKCVGLRFRRTISGSSKLLCLTDTLGQLAEALYEFYQRDAMTDLVELSFKGWVSPPIPQPPPPAPAEGRKAA